MIPAIAAAAAAMLVSGITEPGQGIYAAGNRVRLGSGSRTHVKSNLQPAITSTVASKNEIVRTGKRWLPK